MSDITLSILRAKVRALVAAHQNLDAAAQAINDRWGENVCKGTLSKRLSGDLPPPPLHHIVALEDELGIYPVTAWMARRAHAERQATDPVAAAQACAKEAGEAVAAVTGAALTAGATERARAITEIDEAIEAMRAARIALQVVSEGDTE